MSSREVVSSHSKILEYCLPRIENGIEHVPLFEVVSSYKLNKPILCFVVPTTFTVISVEITLPTFGICCRALLNCLSKFILAKQFLHTACRNLDAFGI